MCLVRTSEQRATSTLHIINLLAFVTKKSVYYAVQAESLPKTEYVSCLHSLYYT
jgi:hypothetical protein